MKPKKGDELIRGLKRKGFREENRDHKYLFLYVNEKKSSIRTKISHGIKEYDDNLLSLMARQVHLSSKQFIDLVACPLTHEKYIEILKEEGTIKSESNKKIT